MALVKHSNCYPAIGYYPVRKIRSKCNAESWEIKERVGEKSVYGKLWQACCQGNCKYVLKYQSFSISKHTIMGITYEPVTKSMIRNEIDIQDAIAKLKLSVPVEEAWFCEKGGVIVMRVLKTTVRNLMKKYSHPKILHDIVITCLALIQSLHIHDFYHGDSHLNNFMVNFSANDAQEAEKEGEKDKYEIYNYKYYFIDFGKSGKLPSNPNTRKTRIIEDYRKVASDLQKLADHEKNGIKKSHFEKMVEFLGLYIRIIIKRS